jgi:hypothetical protein
VSITVVNGSGVSGGNIYYTTHVSRPDFGDVRFTWYNSTSGQEQDIPYWRENVHEGANATFWVKIPGIPADPASATIYVYYGKSDVATTSNGDATFIFFDDFDDGSIDVAKWVNMRDAVESGGAFVGNGGNQRTWAGSTQTFSAPFEVRIKMRGSASGDFDSGIRVGNLYFISDYGVGNPIIGTGWRYPSGSAGDVVSWHVYVATVLPTSQTFQDLTANKYVAATYSYNAGPLSLIGDSDSQDRDTLYDWILVRNYISPEPTHEAWGSEESYENTGGGVTIKLKNEGSLTVHIISLWVNNATFHKRYDVDLFINPGETLPYTRTDIALPEGSYMIKVVTERGNIAVYSKG